ncbi:CPBP family glutamic-type intramembrane protease [Streptomyces sp. P1-3]|uniref:CPBP family glutamic-type intramembrane protease n=1 Tax=Streptomyces sp. P1-3 TaxID=3421658 RepID=UPI003D35A025
MTEHHRGTPAPSHSRALGQALIGGLIMATALGVGTTLGSVVADAAGATGWAARLIPAVLVSALALPLVFVAACRGRRSPAPLGFGSAGASLRALLTGVGVTAAAAALVLGAGTAAGMLRWSTPDPVALTGFVVSNGAVAFLLEALPEETTLRGHAWTSLRERFGGTGAALGTTAVFLLVPGASTVVEAGTAHLVGAEPARIGISPEGQHPADYLMLLTVFGLTLVAARTAVGRAPLWVAIGTHLTFLTVNRIVLEGDRRDAGWSADQTAPDAVLLVPAYLLVAAAGFAVCRRVGRRRGDEARPPTASPAPPTDARRALIGR